MTKTIDNTELLDLFSQLSPGDQALIFSKMGTLTPEYKEGLQGKILKFNQDLASVQTELRGLGEEAFSFHWDRKELSNDESDLGSYIFFNRCEGIDLNLTAGVYFSYKDSIYPDGDTYYYIGGIHEYSNSITEYDKTCYLYRSKTELNPSKYTIDLLSISYDPLQEAQSKLSAYPEMVARVESLQSRSAILCSKISDLINLATWIKDSSFDHDLDQEYTIHLPLYNGEDGERELLCGNVQNARYDLVIYYDKDESKYKARYDFWMSSSYAC